MEKLIDLTGLNIFKEQIKDKINITYDTSNTRINIKFGTEVLSYIDASPFIVDGMLDDVVVVNQNDAGSEGTYIKFTFNTDSGKSIIYVDALDILKDIPSRLQTVEEEVEIINNDIINKVDKEDGKGLSTNDFTNEYKGMLDNIATESDIKAIF